MKLMQKLKAKTLRTFVADCPVCHKHFYGNKDHQHQVTIAGKNYRIVCETCYKKHLQTD